MCESTPPSFSPIWYTYQLLGLRGTLQAREALSYFPAAPAILPLSAAAETLSGRVVKMVNGDTVYVLDAAKEQHKIRLSGIDAPERGQPFGKKSKQRMSELVASKEGSVDWYK